MDYKRNLRIGVDGYTDNETVLDVYGNVNVSKNINVAGTITYDDVTHVDSIGIVTARSGINVIDGGINVSSGIVTAPAFTGFNYLQAPHGTTVNYSVTVAAKTAAHRYNGLGSGNGYVINGVESPFLTLTPGRTYRFTLSSSDMSSHPFRFYLEADRTTAYTTNVTSTSTYTEIVVTDETPTVLHYQCSAHSYMGNAVQINSNVVNTPYQIEGLSGANITGVSTLGTLEVSNNVNVVGVLTAERLYSNVYGEFTGGGISGTNIVGTSLSISGVSTFQGNVDLGDNDRLRFGDDEDLEIFHTGSASVIRDNGTGNLYLQSNSAGIIFNKGAGSEDLAKFLTDGAVELYYDNSKKFETTGYGVSVSGGIFATGIVTATQFIGDGSGLTNLTGDISTSNIVGTSLSISGISTFNQISAGGATGTDGQYLKSTGNGIAWASFPVVRTGLSTVATAGQTGFTTSYNVGFIDVYVNGIRLTDSEFTATDGTNIGLSTACFGGEYIDIIAYNTVSTGSGGGGGGSLTIQDEGTTVSSASTLNFTGAGVEVSSGIATINIDGFSTQLSTSSADLLSHFYKVKKSITVGTGTTLYVNNTDTTTGNIVITKLGSVHVASGATFHIGAGTTLIMNVLGAF